MPKPGWFSPSGQGRKPKVADLISTVPSPEVPNGRESEAEGPTAPGWLAGEGRPAGPPPDDPEGWC